MFFKLEFFKIFANFKAKHAVPGLKLYQKDSNTGGFL